MVASPHYSGAKTQMVAGGLMGAVTLALTDLPASVLGLQHPLFGGAWLGPVEAFTLTALATAWAWMWARGRVLAERNKASVAQVLDADAVLVAGWGRGGRGKEKSLEGIQFIGTGRRMLAQRN